VESPRLWSHPSILLAVLSVIGIGAGLLLLAGLWTPVVGTLVAVISVWKIFLLPEKFVDLHPLGNSRCGLGTARPPALGPWMPASLDGNASTLEIERASSTYHKEGYSAAQARRTGCPHIVSATTPTGVVFESELVSQSAPEQQEFGQGRPTNALGLERLASKGTPATQSQ